MNKYTGHGAASLSALAVLAISARRAQPQAGGSLPANVKLQATTLGTAQTGNSNQTGKVIAGQRIGGGGLAWLNAANIASGTAADARLSRNIALLNTA